MLSIERVYLSVHWINYSLILKIRESNIQSKNDIFFSPNDKNWLKLLTICIEDFDWK